MRSPTSAATRKLRTILGATLLCGMLASPAIAEDGTGWRLRFDLAFFDTTGSNGVVVVDGTVVSAGLDWGSGAGVRAEYRMNERLGVEIGVLGAASVDTSVEAGPGVTTTSVELNAFTPWTAGLNVHLIPDQRLDLYAGVMAAWVRYSDVDVVTQVGSTYTSVSADNDFGPGAILGLDVPIGEMGRWVFQANLRYIQTSVSSDRSGYRADFDVNPTIFSIGFGYRWGR